MRLLAKDYFTLGELVDEWCLPEADILYLAENGQLRLAVRVFGLAVEKGDIEVTDDEILCAESSVDARSILHLRGCLYCDGDASHIKLICCAVNGCH